MSWREGTQSPSSGYQSLVAGKGITKADKLARKLIICLQGDNRKRDRIETITFMEGNIYGRGLRRVKRATKVFDYIHEV